LNIWPGQTWRDRATHKLIRLDEITLDGLHAEGVMLSSGVRRRVSFTRLLNTWERVA
jgi:hypothetical protein